MKRSIHGACMVRDTLAKLIRPLYIACILHYLIFWSLLTERGRADSQCSRSCSGILCVLYKPGHTLSLGGFRLVSNPDPALFRSADVLHHQHAIHPALWKGAGSGFETRSRYIGCTIHYSGPEVHSFWSSTQS